MIDWPTLWILDGEADCRAILCADKQFKLYHDALFASKNIDIGSVQEMTEHIVIDED